MWNWPNYPKFVTRLLITITPFLIGLPRCKLTPGDITSPYALWVKDSLEVAFDQVR